MHMTKADQEERRRAADAMRAMQAMRARANANLDRVKCRQTLSPESSITEWLVMTGDIVPFHRDPGHS